MQINEEMLRFVTTRFQMYHRDQPGPKPSEYREYDSEYNIQYTDDK